MVGETKKGKATDYETILRGLANQLEAKGKRHAPDKVRAEALKDVLDSLDVNYIQYLTNETRRFEWLIYNSPYEIKICPVCEGEFLGKSSAKFCGNNCKQKNHQNKKV